MKRFLSFIVLFFISISACVFQEKLPQPVVQAQHAIVKIIISGPLTLRSQGTGFFIDQNTLVTNYHVIDSLHSQHTKIRFLHSTFHNPLKEIIQFKKIKHLSALHDMAVLEVTGYKEPFLKLGSSLSEDIYTIGFPIGEFKKIKGNSIKQKDTDYFYKSTKSSLTLAGASGSPMLNIKGEVIGIFFASLILPKLSPLPKNDNLDFTEWRSRQWILNTYLQAKPVQYLSQLLNTNELPLKKPEELIAEEDLNLKVLAQSGNKEAQFRTGVKLLYKEDFELALKWILKAAKQGHTFAIDILADMYSTGRGVEQNRDKASEWQEKNIEFYNWLQEE